jgi:hypothetical protein
MNMSARSSKLRAHPFFTRFLPISSLVALVALATACTGTGGGQLPPSAGFAGPASFGFDFSCERSSQSTSPNPPTGRLRIQLSYTEHGTYLAVGSPFSVHGTVDVIDPVVESAICIGQNPPPEPANTLVFLGRFRPTSSAPAGLEACPTRETATTPLCRFEVIVQDNDRNLAPSSGDFFSIKLASATVLATELDPATVVYARAGLLDGGNLTVK